MTAGPFLFASQSGGKIKAVGTFLNKAGESAEIRRREVHQAVGWYAAFTHDLFG